MKQRNSSLLITRANSLICGSLLFIVSSLVFADPTADPFLRSEVKTSDVSTYSFTTLSNEDLLIRANQMKYDELTPSQRAMNYQWLSEHSDAESSVHGDKAVSKLVERHLKAYIERKGGEAWLKDKLMPDSTTSTSFIKGVDYDVKLRANKLVIGISYEF